MKHQYESEILFQLMERDGFNIPSSVPPYESEIKAYLINQVKLAYPKLTDYEAEWLLYNYTKHLPADFPISSATNVTKATFENVVPFAYQSAILKGQTLVNLVNQENQIYSLSADGSYKAIHIPLRYDITDTTKKFFLSYQVITNTIEPQYRNFGLFATDRTNNCGLSMKIGGGTIGKQITVNTISKTANYLRIYINSDVPSGTFAVTDIMLIEYQDGMENSDIPYFEGMQSVQTPVLKTVGKNLFDMSEIVMSDFEKNKYQNGYYGKEIQLQPNTSYTIKPYLTSEITNTDVWTVFNIIVKGVKTEVVNVNYTGSGVNKNSWNTQTFRTDESGVIGYSIYVNRDKEESWFGNLPIEVQLEEGSTATPYEPFKSDILTTPSDLELCGIGDVKDTLDCLTGEVVERVGEIVLDGSQPIFKLAYEKDDTAKCCIVRIKLDGAATGTEKGVYTNICCDKYNVVDTVENEQNSEGIKLFNQLDYVEIRLSILKTKLSSCDISGINGYLSSNPVTVQYQLKEESVKTVDLETVNESGESVHFMPFEGTMHVQSSGEPIQPTFDMSVPVEATTQNLASFIDLEMEE